MSSAAYRKEIAPELVRELFDYNPETGELSRKNNIGRPRSGKGTTGKGYSAFLIDGKLYFAHFIAWVHYYGTCPPNDKVLDHKDRNKANIKIDNLRLVSQRLNCLNAKKRSSITGYRGVYPTGDKFMAKIRISGKLTHLGTFNTAEEASIVYARAKDAEVKNLESK